MFQSLLSNKSIVLILIIELLSALGCGLFLCWFFSSMASSIGSRPLEWDWDCMMPGIVLGASIIGPAINAIVLFCTHQRWSALIALLIAIAGFLVCFRLIPYFQNRAQAKLDAAPAEVIAQRAIDTVKSEHEYNSSVEYINWVDLQLLNGEGCGVRLDPAKTKKVVECTAKLIAEDESLSPRVTEYGWRTTNYNNQPYEYVMVLYLEDGSNATLRYLKAEEWEQLGLPNPPILESAQFNRFYAGMIKH